MIKITSEMLNGISPLEAERMGLKEQKLEKKKCVPCSTDTPPMSKEEIRKYLKEVNGWAAEGYKIKKTIEFKGFKETVDFVNRVAGIAEEQGHHPDICVSYNRAEIILWTHKIKGLHENDFIMAAKIDQLLR